MDMCLQNPIFLHYVPVLILTNTVDHACRQTPTCKRN